MPENETRRNETFPRRETIKVEPSRDERDPDKRIQRPVLYFENVPVWLVDRQQYGLLQVNDEVVVEILADKQEGHYLGKLIDPTKTMQEQESNPAPANPSAQEARPVVEEVVQEAEPQVPEAASETPNVAQERAKSRDRLDTGALRQEMSRKLQLYERPKMPEIKKESVPKLLKLVAEIRDAKEREMVEVWARANDDVIKDKFPGVKTVSFERKRQVLIATDPTYFADEDETGDYRQLEVVFFDLDENRENASEATLISLVHFLNKKQVQLEGERTSAVSANSQEALQRVNEQIQNCLLLEEEAHRVVSGGELPDLTREAEIRIGGDLNSRWQQYKVEPITDRAILDKAQQLGDPPWTPWRVKVVQESGYRVEPRFGKDPTKWFAGLRGKVRIGVRIVDSNGAEVPTNNPGIFVEDLAEGQYKNRKLEEFKGELLPSVLQTMKIEWLRNDFIDESRIEEQFKIAEDEVMSKTLAKRIETAQRRAGNKEQVKEYKETLEDQGLDMKTVIKGLMGKELKDDETSIRDFLKLHGFEGDDYYAAVGEDDRKALLGAQKRNMGSLLFVVMKLFSKLNRINKFVSGEITS